MRIAAKSNFLKLFIITSKQISSNFFLYTYSYYKGENTHFEKIARSLNYNHSNISVFNKGLNNFSNL